MAGPFKAYDIRGIYGDELTEETAYAIGRAYASFLKPKTVVVGYDMRPHSIPLTTELCKGLTVQGVDVINLGMCSTPMVNFANGSLKADGSIMVTASHNPGEYNGFKLCRDSAIPISGDTGIKDIERMIEEEGYAPEAEQAGSVTTHDIFPDYQKHVLHIADLPRPIHIAIDYANAMGICEAKVFEDLITSDGLFDVYDGTFPHHEANPLNLGTFDALKHKMKSGEYDFGIAFDGDADRVGFTDEDGRIISMDLITALIAKAILQNESGNVFYDLRSSWATKEVIAESGGTPMMSRVGHSFIKQQMRDQDALFAGELSGHYYFRENFYAESTALAVIYIANIVSQSGKKLSDLVEPLRRYVASGEINNKVKDTDAVFEQLKATYADGHQFHLDGLSVEYKDWWFNVRCSNTEPWIRLNLEAKTADEMLHRRDEVLAVIRGQNGT